MAEQAPLAVVGVGYVGLPLAVAFSAIRPTYAFDHDAARIEELVSGFDRTLEVAPDELRQARNLRLTADPREIADARVFVVAVPTPVDGRNDPDLEPLMSACALVAAVLKPGDLVVFESTVFPGATEELCTPVLERGSGLVVDVDFGVGYSPERTNPGDAEHRLANVVKVTSGSSAQAAAAVDELYRAIVPAGTHQAPSIRIAEAAKVIENVQRDLNIALVNEFALLFERLGIDTADVLAAAATKWNSLPFTPGLVGGHCVGVDPYYLAAKAAEVGYAPEVILAGRVVNDAMGGHVADRVSRGMAGRGRQVAGARVLVLGLAFKENCPDVRNSGVFGLVRRLTELGAIVTASDPWVDPTEVAALSGLRPLPLDEALAAQYDAAVVAVAHRDFADVGPRLRAAVGDGYVFDVKSLLPRELVDERL